MDKERLARYKELDAKLKDESLVAEEREEYRILQMEYMAVSISSDEEENESQGCHSATLDFKVSLKPDKELKK